LYVKTDCSVLISHPVNSFLRQLTLHIFYSYA